MRDAFDEALQGAKIGRRFQTDHKWLSDLTLIVPRCAGGILQALRDEEPAPEHTRQLPEVLSGVSDRPDFNAFAFAHNGQYAIAVNYGVLILVQDLVNRLLCIPEVFPWIGDPTAEDPNRPFHPTSGNAMEYMRTFIAEPRRTTPKDPVRRDTAKLLVVAAIEFIVSHELWHILGGHLGWHASRTSELTFAEARQSGGGAHGLAYQALEMDADAFAVWVSLLRTLALAAAEHDGGNLSRVITTPAQAVEVTLICAVVMVGTFLGRPTDPSTWPRLTHPPAGVRHGMNLTAADRTLRHLGKDELVERTTGNQAWAVAFGHFILRRVWTRIGNPDWHEALRVSFGPNGVAHMTAVMEKLGALKSELNRHSYLPPR